MLDQHTRSSNKLNGLTLVTKAEKQAVEKTLFGNHDLFSGHRLDIGTDTEFKEKLTSKVDKAAHSRKLPTPIKLKDYLIVDVTLMHKLLISSTAIFQIHKPNLHKGGPPENYVSLWTGRKTQQSLFGCVHENFTAS